MVTLGLTELAASYSFDEIDIDGGVMSNPKTAIEYYPWICSPRITPQSVFGV